MARCGHVLPEAEISFESGLALAAHERVRLQSKAGDLGHGRLETFVLDSRRLLLVITVVKLTTVPRMYFADRLKGYGGLQHVRVNKVIVFRSTVIDTVICGAIGIIGSGCSSGVVDSGVIRRH